ncbi:reverse transcriptase domain-containing protein [Tanacetum coccineum]
MAVVFAFDKFLSYLVLSKTVIFTDHPALKYLFAKQDAKPRLIRWILLLPEFDIKIKNKKGAENVATDHLSRLENPYLEDLRDDDVDDNFPEETLMNVSSTEEDKIPWFTNFANYLIRRILRIANYHETMPWVAENPFIYSVVENTCNEAKLYDLDKIGEATVKGNFLYIKKDPSKKSTLGGKMKLKEYESGS